jgi:hypothetical protein
MPGHSGFLMLLRSPEHALVVERFRFCPALGARGKARAPTEAVGVGHREISGGMGLFDVGVVVLK